MAKADFGALTFESKKNANIFPVKKANYDMKEELTAVNIGFSAANTTAHIKIYKNVDFTY